MSACPQLKPTSPGLETFHLQVTRDGKMGRRPQSDAHRSLHNHFRSLYQDYTELGVSAYGAPRLPPGWSLWMFLETVIRIVDSRGLRFASWPRQHGRVFCKACSSSHSGRFDAPTTDKSNNMTWYQHPLQQPMFPESNSVCVRKINHIYM